MTGQIAERGKPAPVHASQRWPVERTHAWGNQFKQLVWNTERPDPVIDAFLAFAHAIIELRRLIRCAWTPVPLGHPTLTTPLSHHPRRC